MNIKSKPVVSAPITPAAAREAAATSASQPAFTVTDRELEEMTSGIASEAVQSQAPTPAPAGLSVVAPPRPATSPETCAAHKLLTSLDRATSKAIVGLRDHVVVPANLYVADQAKPQALAAVATGCLVAASGAGRLSAFLARLAQNAAAKSSARHHR